MLVLALLAFAVPASAGKGLGDYYVTSNVLNERSGAGTSYSVANRIYRGQKLTVYAWQGEWARVTDFQYQPRWVHGAYLSRQRPVEPKQPALSRELTDPRIEGIPKVGEYGLTKRDVTILRKGALQMLKTGRCSKIAYGDKSVNRSGYYYVNCGGSQNIFFTEADVR